ncbi:MAG: L-histidine N(alpha)-methyltransferase [Rhodospirillales bacterium]|nr:MAG: L-histidine N(alpha)-methyltransferase [Rhodospirillales bacterium]
MGTATSRAGAAIPLPAADGRFLDDVLAGLAVVPKAIPAKYFYDSAGSRLFDRICALEEYYPTRTELAILAANRGAIAATLADRPVLIELGAGSTTKVRHLLDAAPGLAAFVAVDISGEHLVAACARLARDYPATPVIPLVVDFCDPLRLDGLVPAGRRVAFFPGSTIGNLTPAQAETFLRRLAMALGPGAGLIIGVDLEKPAAILDAAYDDALGVTAAFNLNLLRRINRELGGDFALDGFRHHAFYNGTEKRVEMHLVSRRAQRVRVAGCSFRFEAGESIHTENSYKYSLDRFAALAAGAGWTMADVWTDPARLFSVQHLTAG